MFYIRAQNFSNVETIIKELQVLIFHKKIQKNNIIILHVSVVTNVKQTQTNTFLSNVFITTLYIRM